MDGYWAARGRGSLTPCGCCWLRKGNAQSWDIGKRSVGLYSCAVLGSSDVCLDEVCSGNQ